MIQYEDIAIGHIPRTGGDVTNFLVYAHLMRQHSKHYPPTQTKCFDRKRYFLLFRRLPNWFLSYLTCGIQYGKYPKHIPWPKPTLEEIFNIDSGYGEKFIHEESIRGPLVTIADRYIDLFTIGQPPISGIIRLEFIAEDLGKLLGDKIRVPKVFSKKRMPKYNKDPLAHWSKKQIQILYDMNPKWSEIERRCY